MDDLMQWLGEQLDEDERIARDCSGDGKWDELDIAIYGPDLGEEVRVHMARHDPARVLREVVTKRNLLAGYAAIAQAVEELDALLVRLKAKGRDTFMTDAERHSKAIRRDTLHGVLRTLAAPYSDRPGFREEWRP